jgi:hypothetical protein
MNTVVKLTPPKKDKLNYIINSLLAHLRNEITKIERKLEKNKRPLNIIALKYTKSVMYSHLFKIIKVQAELHRHIYNWLYRNEVLNTPLYHKCLIDLKSIERFYPEYFYQWYQPN